MIRAALAFLLLLALGAPAAAQERASVTIVFFADVSDIEPLASSGDLPRIATVIAREKASRPNVIVANGGNALSPSFITAVDQGTHMTRLLNQMLIDVMGANIHEFDFGADVAARRFAELEFPVLGANVFDGSGRPAGIGDGVIIAAGGFRIGFVGAVRADTATIANVGRLRFTAVAPQVQESAAALRARGAGVVVLLCAGVVAECDAARDAVDIVLGSNGPAAADARSDGRRMMLRAGLDGNIVAAIDIELARTQRDIGLDIMRVDPMRGAIDATPQRAEAVVTWNAALRLIDTREVEPDQLIEIVSQIELDRASVPLNEVIATATGALSSRTAAMRVGEASMADVIADALRARAGADVALINAGTIRGNRDYDAGAPVRLRTVIEELPFPNDLAVVTMTGAALRAALEHGLSLLPQPAARFLQVSGLVVRFDPQRPAGRRVLAVEVGGRPLDPRRRYRVATTTFLARGGDGYGMIGEASRVALDGPPLPIRDVVIDYVRGLRALPVPPDGRLRAATR